MPTHFHVKHPDLQNSQFTTNVGAVYSKNEKKNCPA